ncbi:MAG: hypothetical protein HYY55_03850 [Candidatus Niyogibacteria bacterium]|nr:MAG: hypothetical protein HYY55_03850 [Candidatus Niyogibacteria bacterium]
MSTSNKKYLIIGALAVFLTGTLIVSANHSWGGYHWGRTANPFTLELGSNVSEKWLEHLNTTAADWSLSAVLDTVVGAGKTKPRNCRATDGRVEVCSASYGFNGWLGIAQIWISGDHIVKGATKVNDTYFDMPDYNKPEWRNLVMCQEVGHTLGLAHQDEAFDNPNLGTCMDYTNDPLTNQHPNQHDYDQLEAIYAHLDSVQTVGSSDGGSGPGKGNGKGNKLGAGIDLDNPLEWGRAVKKDAQGKNSLFVRDLGRGEKVFTFVIWAR